MLTCPQEWYPPASDKHLAWDVAFLVTALAKSFARRAALDDLKVTMIVATWATRLLHLSARTPDERRCAAKLVLLLQKARATIERL